MPGNITLKKDLCVFSFSMVVTMDQYTRHYVNESGVCENGPVYRASFSMQSGKVIGSFIRGLFRFVKHLLYSGAKAV